MQHEKASLEMFDHLVEVNGLETEMQRYGLDSVNDLVFIKEMLYKPLDTDSAQDTGDLVSHAHVNCVKSISIIIFTAASI